MPIMTRQTHFADFEALRDVVPDHASDVVQLDPGRMNGSISHFTFDPGFSAATGSFSAGVRLCGMLSEERWCLGFVLDGTAVLPSNLVGAGDLIITPPGQDRYTRFHGGARYFAALITPQEMQRFLAPYRGAYENLIHHRYAVIRATEATVPMTQLRLILMAIAQLAPTFSDQAAEFYKRNILELVTAPIRRTAHYRGARVLAQHALVREIDHLTEVNNLIHISELCERFDVHDRELFRAFHDVLHTSPGAFLRAKRFNAVHSVLTNDGLDMTVQEVAAAHGFLQYGRFAGQYNGYFGENPSRTLRRAQVLHGHRSEA